MNISNSNDRQDSEINWQQFMVEGSIVHQHILQVAYDWFHENRTQTKESSMPTKDEFSIQGDQGIKNFIINTFNIDILRQCMILGIQFYPDLVFFSTQEIKDPEIPKNDFVMNSGNFRDIASKFPELYSYIYRAGSFTGQQITWINQGYYIPTKIVVFNDEYDPITNLIRNGDFILAGTPYLDQTDDPIDVFRRGTIAHEIGHHLYNHLLSNEQKDIWKRLIAELNAPITPYILQYLGGEKFFEESFSEAVRVYATNPDYLRRVISNGIKIHEFLESLNFKN